MTATPAITHVDTHDHRAMTFHQHVLMDLDRCEHGRQEGAACSSCGDRSLGNPLWNRARATPGVGSTTVARLIARFGTPETIPPRLIGFDMNGDPWVWPTDRDHLHHERGWRP